MRRPPGADGWPYGRLSWARGLRVARTARAHTRSVGGRAADNSRLVACGQASSQGWRQINPTTSDFQILVSFSMLANFEKTLCLVFSSPLSRVSFFSLLNIPKSPIKPYFSAKVQKNQDIKHFSLKKIPMSACILMGIGSRVHQSDNNMRQYLMCLTSLTMRKQMVISRI